MERTCKEALRHRRSYYALTSESLLSDEQIERLVRFALKYTPSAYNAQTARIVLLLDRHHRKLWQIVKQALKAIVPEGDFPRTQAKIDRSFASGYGTVLFFEDTAALLALQQQNPQYAGNFPIWSEQSSGMHQLVVWTLLEDAGFGASLQHYNPLIDKPVHDAWGLPSEWRLIAQMPFGLPAEEPSTKTFAPMEARLRIFR